MKTIASLLFYLPLVCVAADSATSTPPVTNQVNIVAEVLRCEREDSHLKTKTGVWSLRPWLSDKNEEVVRRISEQGSRTLLTPDGQPDRILRDTIFVIFDLKNPVKLNDAESDAQILALCSLLLGNGAEVVMVDLSDVTSEQRASARKTIVSCFAPKLKGHKDAKGKPLDLEKLLETETYNAIALFEDPGEVISVSAIHLKEAEYEPKVGKLAKESLALWESWKKQDEEKAKGGAKLPEKSK